MTYKEEVRGSNPLAPTGFFKYPKQKPPTKYLIKPINIEMRFILF
jgi:hypothetical protein